MLSFKRFDHATVTLAGIEGAHHSKKRHFDLSLRFSSEARTPPMRDAVFGVRDNYEFALDRLLFAICTRTTGTPPLL